MCILRHGSFLLCRGKCVSETGTRGWPRRVRAVGGRRWKERVNFVAVSPPDLFQGNGLGGVPEGMAAMALEPILGADGENSKQ